MVRRSVADDSYGRASLTWSFELGEVNALPCSEIQLAVLYRKRHIVTDEHRFDVRCGITFRMTVIGVLRHKCGELMQQIALHVRVRVLVHEHRRGGVDNVYHAYTLANLGPRDRGAHSRRHIDGHLALLGAHGELLVMHAHDAIIRSEAGHTQRRYFDACPPGAKRASPRSRACAPRRTPTRLRSMPMCCLVTCSASGRKGYS